MKRWLAVLLAAAMVVLSACGGGEKKETEPDTKKETAQQTEAQTETPEETELQTEERPQEVGNALLVARMFHFEMEDHVKATVLLYPQDMTCGVADPSDRNVLMGTYTQKDDTVQLVCGDKTWNFVQSADGLTYVAEGSVELYAKGSVFFDNEDVKEVVEDGTFLECYGEDVLFAGEYMVTEGGKTATLQVDLEAMELTLTDYEGVVYESSFAVVEGMIEVVTGGKLIQISAWGDTAYVMCYPEGSYEEWEEYTFEYQY